MPSKNEKTYNSRGRDALGCFIVQTMNISFIKETIYIFLVLCYIKRKNAHNK